MIALMAVPIVTNLLVFNIDSPLSLVIKLKRMRRLLAIFVWLPLTFRMLEKTRLIQRSPLHRLAP
jgi:hypothetical protein